MTIVQSKLKECLEKGSMNSFERLSAIFQTGEGGTETGNEPMDVLPTEEPPVAEKGENKVPTKRRRHQKHRLQKKASEERKKAKPRYYCEF